MVQIPITLQGRIEMVLKRPFFDEINTSSNKTRLLNWKIWIITDLKTVLHDDLHDNNRIKYLYRKDIPKRPSFSKQNIIDMPCCKSKM